MADEILVAYSIRHESSREIASPIVDVLRAADLPVRFEPVTAVGDLRGVWAAIFGCTIYDGTWFPGVEAFMEKHARKLSGMPAWLFASGLTATPPAEGGADVPDALVHAVERIGFRDVALFAGPHQPLHIGESIRVLARLPAARFSDHRDWAAIERWAASIRDELVRARPAANDDGPPAAARP